MSGFQMGYVKNMTYNTAMTNWGVCENNQNDAENILHVKIIRIPQ